ncbi:MAG: biotin--[acetyl-CoA-carboxylase] ligase [Thermoanaerobaculales bacterium]|jgi:BirA family biotin operon repressor/biotin-[acetyl-CoA-carboxylase] ligase|nr:biotin--[acetyl-CoA-carboxylase] ligase [Thermoanaerobaculales bacterium]
MERAHTSVLGARLARAVRPAVENCLYFRMLDSTQSCALRLIEQAEEEEVALPATLIVAGHQESGRGRADRRWQSPPGGLYLSWVVSELDRTVVAKLPMIAAAAAAEAVIGIGIDEVAIKWPNDLLVDGRKLAGLLVHSRHGATNWAAVGFGINLTRTPSIPAGSLAEAISVADLLSPHDAGGWAEGLAGVFVAELEAGIAEPAGKVDLWRKRLVHRKGDPMTVRRGDASELQGRFSGLTADGHLRLDCNGSERVISAGDVVEWAD